MAYTNEQRSRDWAFVWATAEGQRVIADLFNRNGLFRPVAPALRGAICPYMLAFGEGRRNAILDIVQALGVTPVEFKRMADAMKEVEDVD